MEPKIFNGIFGRMYSFMTPFMRRVYGDVIRRMDIPKDREISVLEIGSGDGAMASLMLASHPLIRRYTLVDPAETQLSIARKKLARHTDREIRYICSTVEELQEVQGDYDYVISFASLHHWIDIARGFENCVRACKGTVIVIDGIKNRKYSDIYRAVRDIGGGHLVALFYWIGSRDALNEDVLDGISLKVDFPVNVMKEHLIYEFRIEKGF
ncbi:MAG TPA: class I SAM-dependent methyltransferase [Candidatus Hydrogenedentes bacterium]|mgnify:CR=1 FL=1|nr:class I SAM-dependent methyltransferase [Candidatus Hydrogenedentota bacterium]